MIYVVELDDAQANLILNALAELPIKVAFSTLAHVEKQVREQQAALRQAEQEQIRNAARAGAADFQPAKAE